MAKTGLRTAGVGEERLSQAEWGAEARSIGAALRQGSTDLSEHPELGNKFKSITYFAQGHGLGKTYTINKLVADEKKWGKVEPTRLDLDSTKTSMEHVCRRLMGPMRAQTGLLIIHIGHDTSPLLVNEVLDNLIFFGRVQSNSGLSVTVKSQGWDLVVEFQEPPTPEVGHSVNEPWKHADGRTDITLLACSGLAEEGTLLDYDLSVHPGVEEALQFIKSVLKNSPEVRLPDDKLDLARMLALGHRSMPAAAGTDQVEHDAFKEMLKGCSPRVLTRAVRFMAKKYLIFKPSSPAQKGGPLVTPSNQAKFQFVAHLLMHEMHHFVNPSSPNHMHGLLGRDTIENYIQLSGEPDELLKNASMKYEESLVRTLAVMRQTASSTVREDEEARMKERLKMKATAPLYILTDTLGTELGVDKKAATTCLRDSNYVLIPDFLQKLIQLGTHLDLDDPPILQGPSGTGKSYAVKMLSMLMQLPVQSHHLAALRGRSAFKELQTVLYRWVKSDTNLRKLFPNDDADVQVGGEHGVLWGMQIIKATTKGKNCMAKLVERENAAALEYVRSSVNDLLGPLINDEKANPDIAKVRDADKTFKSSTEVLKNGVDSSLDAKTRSEQLFSAINYIAEKLTKVSSGFLTSQIAGCIEAVFRSPKMKELAGRAFEEFQKILNANATNDAFRVWAKEVVQVVKGNSETLCQLVKEKLREELKASPLLSPPADLVQALADTGTSDDPTTGEQLGELLVQIMSLKRDSAHTDILMRYDMTPDMLFEQMLPALERALACPEIKFKVMIDEMNATKMLGLVKRIVVDRYWDRWEELHPETSGMLPPNVNFVGAVNPSKKDALLEGSEASGTREGVQDLGFDVTPMPPSLMEYIVPWRQLAEGQRKMFIERLIGANKNIFSADIRRSEVDVLGELLLNAHRYAQRQCQNKRSTVSQRDIHRTMKLFDFFFKQDIEFVESRGAPAKTVWVRALSSMLLGIAVSYYFRFAPDERKGLSELLTELLAKGALGQDQVVGLGDGMNFADVVQRAVSFFCNSNHLKLPEAVYAHQGLMENLFVQMVCFDIRLAVILEGAPGTSKTLSNNIIRDNMTGHGHFWDRLCQISDICRYQGSAQSSAEEIKRKCEEAYTKQLENDKAGAKHKRTLLFVDEAGLVKGETDERKWALKVLHYYLEGANLSSVLMTNATLDPAIGNRCIVVYMAKPEANELTNMCAGILHKGGLQGLSRVAQRIIPACCEAFHKLVPQTSEREELVGYDPSEKFRWWYGLRDLFHMMRYIRRYQALAGRADRTDETKIEVTPELVMRALERNFNGPPEYFDHALKVFSDMLEAENKDYGMEQLRKVSRRKIDVVVDSLKDNNRATEQSSGKNLNDMWVRFKLLVDTTEDGSLLQLLRQSDVPMFKDLSVLSLSALSKGDELMPVTVVSQIAAAMETGKTVWLTNTREIDACLFDVFNQNYVVASSGANEVLHFVAIAIGAALEYKQVHKDFQCIVHVTKTELRGMGKVLPSPFLNRLEKFAISVSDIIEYVGCRMRRSEARTAVKARQRLESFERTLSVGNRCLFSDNDKETFDSIVLEAIQHGKLKDRVRVASRITNDDALSRFVFGSDEQNALWRSLACRMLQVLRPEGMLLGQRMLAKSPAYLRAYFRDLSPWRLKGYLEDLCSKLNHGDATQTKIGWLRSVIYSPANVDFPSLIEEVDGVSQVSVEGLLGSERGHEDLKEELYKFCLATDKSVFVVVMSPDSLGRAESREVRHLLDTPPELKNTEEMQNKAVCILHTFHPTTLTGSSSCTPLFGCGWDQVYIDAAGEHMGLDIMRYVDPAVAGKRPPKARPEWKDIEALLDQAMNGLMQAQSEASARWVPVSTKDPAASLYDLKRPFSEQVGMARELLRICPEVRRSLLSLYRERLPTDLELVEMAKDVVASERSHSLSQRLADEENTAPRALLTFALRFLLDDRNASALLAMNKDGRTEELKRGDEIISRALCIAASATTFDHLRHMKVATLPPLFVGASMPALPGASSLIETLPVPADAVDAVAEAAELEKRYGDGAVGNLVASVHKSTDLVTAFFTDNIRSRVRYNNEALVDQVVKWTLSLVRGLHKQRFGPKETVWSIRALCSVESAAVDDYILAMVPLAATGTLDDVDPEKEVKDKVDRSWVSYELGPKLLIEALPRMKNHLGQFRMACSSMLHRMVPEWVTSSRTLPCLAVVGGLLSDKDGAKVDATVKFTQASMKVKGPIALDYAMLEKALTPSSTPKVALALARLKQGNDDAIPLFIWKQKLSRAMSARVASFLIPSPETVLAEQPAMAELLLKSALAQLKMSKPNAAPSQYVFKLPVVDNTSAAGGSAKELQASVYLALYDLLYDRTLGIDAECLDASMAAKIAEKYFALLETENKLSKSHACMLYCAVNKKVLEVAFLQSLAFAFRRPPSEKKREWEPELMRRPKQLEVTKRLAIMLMEPKGFKCPKLGSDEDRKYMKTPSCAMCEENLLILLNALENGIGVVRGMGTKAMLEYLRDQVPMNDKDQHIGALVTVCGAGMKHKCQNAEPMVARPGDLPFVYMIDDPLHDPFFALKRQLNISTDGDVADTSEVDTLVELLEGMLTKYTPTQVRLLLFYTSFKSFFGERMSHPFAATIVASDKLRCMLSLNEKQLRILEIALDQSKIEKTCPEKVNLLDSLYEGFTQEWTEMIVTALAVACSDTTSWLYSVFLDIDEQKNHFLPGDKTGGAVTHGGGYKLDCVTQLDESGNIHSYARGQPKMSTGSCYLLWGILFGGMALQLAWFPECHSTIWNWVVSPTLHMRPFKYQQNTSNYRHLVQQLTERSVAYHLHMGAHTGLSVDQSQRMYAFLTYEFSKCTVLQRKRSKTRDEALELEAKVEGVWKRYNEEKRSLLVHPSVTMCLTLGSLHSWFMGKRPQELVRAGAVFNKLECLSANDVPKLLNMALHEHDKLTLLAPLLTDVYGFAHRVYRMLSNRLPQFYQDSEGEEAHTAYESVLDMFKQYTPPSQFRQAAEQLSRIKDKWNNYKRRVGPIDYECEEGGINIEMPVDDMRTGAPGLPDTLDFWITLSDTAGQHKNLVKAALLSLTDKYNECQAIVSHYTKTEMEDEMEAVDPMLLNPSKPDLMLREHNGLGEVCRSHTMGVEQVDWMAIETELSFASGLLLPKLLSPVLPVFRFLDPEDGVQSHEIQQQAADLLAVQPDRHLKPLGATQEMNLRNNVKPFSEDQNVSVLIGLVNTFKARDTNPEESLFAALSKRWGQKVSNPIRSGMVVGVTVAQLRSVVQVFIDKLEQNDWLTAHIGADLHVPIGQDTLKQVDRRFVAFATSKPLEEVLAHLDDLIVTAGGFCQSEYPKDPKSSLPMMLATLMLLEGAESDALCTVFEGVNVENIVPFIKLLRKKLRVLRRQASTKEWVEEGAELREFPITIVCKNGTPFGIMYDDDLTVTSVSDGAGMVAGVEEGMRIVAIGEHRVVDRQGADTALNTVGDVFEISVEVEVTHDELERAGTSTVHERAEDDIALEREVTWSALLTEARESDSFCEGFPRSGSSAEGSKMMPRMDSMGAAVPLASRSGLPRSQSQTDAKELESRLRHSEKHEPAGLGERQESSGLGERQDSAFDDALRRQKHEIERCQTQEEVEHGEMEETIKKLKAEKDALKKAQQENEQTAKKLMAYETKVKALEEKLQADETVITSLKNACTAQKDELESQKVAQKREDSDVPDFD